MATDNILVFPRSKIFSALIWYKLTSCDIESLTGMVSTGDCYKLSCALVIKVFVKQILTVNHNLEYKGHSISNQPTLFPIKIDRFFF